MIAGASGKKPEGQYGRVSECPVEIPGVIGAGLVVDRIGRKNTLASFFFVCGVSLIGMMYESPVWISLSLVCLARSAVYGTFQVIYIYTPEVYPTNCRGTGMGLASALSRFAGIITPFVADSILPLYYFAPFIIYALSSFLGTIGSLALPLETSGRAMLDTSAEFSPSNQVPDPIELEDIEMEESPALEEIL
jgi:MFS family permease